MIVYDLLTPDNLDLPYLAGGEAARLFPKHDLSLATAVRMNAAFPYVTPAVNLPVQNGEFDFAPPPGTKIIKP